MRTPQDVLEYWQRQLRYQDWDIDLQIVPHDVIQAAGQCEEWRGARRARIRVASADTMPRASEPIHEDQEVTIVHELLHIVIPGDQEDGSSSVLQEQGVEAIAQALVRARRGESR